MFSPMPATEKAYKLLHDGSLALAHVEAAGMRVDVEYLENSIKDSGARIKKISKQLKNDDLYRKWRKMYGSKAKLGSRQQLMGVLVKEEILKDVEYKERTGNIKADESVLEKINVPFVRQYIELEKLKKAKGTYLQGIKREVVDGFIHPSFNLHIPTTYRSSCNAPNSQNIPRRNEEMARLVRQAFIPRKGHHLVEIDFKGAEVTVAACYNKDPMLIEYVTDKTKDMHRDMAAEIFMVDESQISKTARHTAKNQFVFPEFYGSYYAQCAPSIWESITRHKLKLEDGTLLTKHLKSQGVSKRGNCIVGESPKKGTFEHHLQQVEDHFWNERFSGYSDWKDKWYQKYLKRGWAAYHTGFVIQGLYERNKIINYPIQGSAFHCLLWCLIRLVKWLRQNKMRSKVIAQIHDSMLLDIHRKEMEDVLHQARHLMQKAIRKQWDWLIVPLDVDSEIGRENWYSKEELVI